MCALILHIATAVFLLDQIQNCLRCRLVSDVKHNRQICSHNKIHTNTGKSINRERDEKENSIQKRIDYNNESLNMKNIQKSVEQMVKIATAINANNRLILDFRFSILGMQLCSMQYARRRISERPWKKRIRR